MKNQNKSAVCVAGIVVLAALCGGLSSARAAEFGGAAGSQHPRILLAPGDRPAVLARIKSNPEAAQAKTLLEQQVAALVKAHAADPSATLAKIPALAGGFRGHSVILSKAADAAILNYVTEDAACGQYAADVINFYLSQLATKTPATATICGDSGNDRRGLFPKLALAYDFLQPFLTKPGTTVYDSVTRKRVPFDNAAAQKALINIVRYGMDINGPPDSRKDTSNHAILNAKGVLYPILCIDDRREREFLFDIYWDKGTKAQPSLKNSVLPTISVQGIWPESTSYGGINPMSLFDVIDRYKPELKIIENNTHILEGALLRVQLASPNGSYVRYGDSKRIGFSSGKKKAAHDDEDDEVKAHLDSLPRAFFLAHKKGLLEVQRKAEESIKGLLKDKTPAAWTPGVGSTHNNFGYNPPLALFVDPIPYDPAVSGKFGFSRTVLIQHAGVAVVRNWVEENNVLYGLIGYIGGAHYVHSHCTGISLELYGAGCFMAPDPGEPDPAKRSEPVHTSYRRIYAGNNTVIVNGTSHGRQQGAWKTKSNVWQNNAVNVACEPKHLAAPVSPDFGFATQFLKDTVNDCLQQRTLSVIRTGPQTGYYLDIFRSRANKQNKFHDYIYHNLGDATFITDDQNAALKLTPTTKYDNDIGDETKSPGWRFFENERSTTAVTDAVRVRFDLTTVKRAMNVFLPGGVAREYTSAVGPLTLEAEYGYDRKKTQILAIRQSGEAWQRPFVAVFEPSAGGSPSVSSVKQILKNGALVAIEITSVVAGATITDLVIANAEANTNVSLPEKNISFQGRFAIVRTERKDGKESTSLYIGDGSSLSCGKHQIAGDSSKQGYKLFPAE